MNSESTKASWDIVTARLKHKFAMLTDKETEFEADQKDSMMRNATADIENTNDDSQSSS